MKKRGLNIVDDLALGRLQSESPWQPPAGEWIRVLRTYLRMTQAELGKRAHITQPHLAGIEAGRIDPQVGTLRRIFDGLSCDLILEPRPRKPIKDLLRGRARAVALNRLKQAMGTMALEKQAPDAEIFKLLLEKQTDEILNDPRERLWAKKGE